tara:strand:+ start:119960 stop:120589 length:630 start_codon:yes stop_codon:yes gene_type:complete
MASAKQNEKALLINFNNQVLKSRRLRGFVRDTVVDRVRDSQKQLIKEFDEHKATLEIERGAHTTSSSFLNYGNLFSFIGFEAGSNPTQEIRDIIERQPRISIRHSSSNFKFEAIIRTASKKEIFEKTPSPWEPGRSWAKSMETGMSGFSQYVFFKKFKSVPASILAISRSKGGIQSKLIKRANAGRFKPFKYISDMMNRFEKNIFRRFK